MKNYIINCSQKNGSTLCISELTDTGFSGRYDSFRNGGLVNNTKEKSIKLNHHYQALVLSEYDRSEGKDRSIKFTNASIYSLKFNVNFRNKKPVKGKVSIYIVADKMEEF